jgi:hypothetical protein
MKSIRPPAMIISVRFGHDTQRTGIGEEAEFEKRQLNNFLLLIREIMFRFSTSAAFFANTIVTPRCSLKNNFGETKRFP